MSDSQSSDDELMYSADENFEMKVSVKSSKNNDKISEAKKHSNCQKDPLEDPPNFENLLGNSPNCQKDPLEDQQNFEKDPLEDQQNLLKNPLEDQQNLLKNPLEDQQKFGKNPLEEKSKKFQIPEDLLVDSQKSKTRNYVPENIPKVVARSILVFIVDNQVEIELRQIMRKKEMKAMVFRPRKWDKNTIGTEIEIGTITQCIVIWRETMDAELLAVLTKVEKICYELLCIWVVPKGVPINVMKKRFPAIVRVPEEENINNLLTKLEQIGMPIEKRGEQKWHEPAATNAQKVNWNQLGDGRREQAAGSQSYNSFVPPQFSSYLPTTTKMFFPTPEMPKKGENLGKIQSEIFDPFVVLGVKRKLNLQNQIMKKKTFLKALCAQNEPNFG
ncbi:hypothetical protein niasHT_034600 [Heterodera trifolii]|uniref:Uncharacterized protein n=1 Tax=Heterodera trifolii TaxID=157864 RepID=A0ABD2IPL7_9BILA